MPEPVTTHATHADGGPLLTQNERNIIATAGFSWGCFFFGVCWSLYTRTWRALWLQLAGYVGVVVFAFLGLEKTMTLLLWGASHVYISWNARALRAATLKRKLGLPL